MQQFHKNNAIYSMLHRAFSSKITGQYIGLEFEYPIIGLHPLVNITNGVKSFFEILKNQHEFQVNKISKDNEIISLKNVSDNVIVALEFSYHTIELMLPPLNNLVEVESLFLKYFTLLQTGLSNQSLSLVGLGLNQLLINRTNIAVNTNHYKTLEAFSTLFNNPNSLISNTSWPSCIAGLQVHIDVNLKDLCNALNMLTKLEFINDLFFVNSAYVEGETILRNFRRYCYQNSGFNLVPGSISSYSELYSIAHLVEELYDTGVFFDGQNQILFEPVTLLKSINSNVLSGYRIIHGKLDPEKIVVNNSDFNIKIYRNIKNFATTSFGTIETRIDCCQPIEDTMLVPAYYLGLITNMKQIHELIDRDFKKLKDSNYDKKMVIEISLKIYGLISDSLKIRGFGEEVYIKPLLNRIINYISPADTFIKEVHFFGDITKTMMNNVAKINKFLTAKSLVQISPI